LHVLGNFLAATRDEAAAAGDDVTGHNLTIGWLGRRSRIVRAASRQVRLELGINPDIDPQTNERIAEQEQEEFWTSLQRVKGDAED
jgi:hypothetical protein